MEFAFADVELRAMCLNEYRAQQTIGNAATAKLMSRLSDLAAAHTVSDVLALFRKSLRVSSEDPTQIEVDLDEGWQLFFQSGHVKDRLLNTGKIDWSRTKRIKILGLERQL